MKRIKHLSRTKKFVAAAVTVGLTVGLAGAAFAYFTSTGTGTGSATAGHAAALTITGGTASLLYPGGPALSVPYTISAPTADESLGTVSIDPTSIVVTEAGAGLTAAGPPEFAPACVAADFSVATSASAIGEVDVGTPFVATTPYEPTIKLVENHANQDACQDATLTFTMNAAQGA